MSNLVELLRVRCSNCRRVDDRFSHTCTDMCEQRSKAADEIDKLLADETKQLTDYDLIWNSFCDLRAALNECWNMIEVGCAPPAIKRHLSECLEKAENQLTRKALYLSPQVNHER